MYSTTFIIAGLFLFFVFILIIRGMRIIPQASILIIERLGRYNRTLTSGLQIVVPIIDKPRSIEWTYFRRFPDGRIVSTRKSIDLIDLRETVYDFPRQNVITKDNVVIEIDAIMYYQIVDPVKAVYEIANLPDAIEKLTKTTLRNVIGDMDLDETLSSRDKINNKLRLILDDATDKWGVKINRIEIQDINPPKDIKDAMEKQMRAERDRRAVILTAEGEKQARILESEGIKMSAINKAEGEKQSHILQAQGEAQAKAAIAEGEAIAIEKVTEAIKKTKTDAGAYLVAIKYIEMLRELANGKDSKMVYLPYEASALLSSVGVIKDIFKESK